MSIEKNKAVLFIPGLLLIVIGSWYFISNKYYSSASVKDSNGSGSDYTIGTKAAPEYVGLNESDAIDKASKAKFAYRIVKKDGESFMVTADYSTDRVNFEIQDGKVTKAEYY